jgi:nucleolar pre-ribosomal-associated protein 1
VRKRVPDLGTVVGFAMAAAKGSSGVGSSEVEKSRRAVLTEAALRLLSLYHLTLPSLVAEGKFDAGKLLVPAEEKGKGKGAATEAGDGWGFARAELKGVDALSQLHVLRLVGEGGDFVWGGKAGTFPSRSRRA